LGAALGPGEVGLDAVELILDFSPDAGESLVGFGLGARNALVCCKLDPLDKILRRSLGLVGVLSRPRNVCLETTEVTVGFRLRALAQRRGGLTLAHDGRCSKHEARGDTGWPDGRALYQPGPAFAEESLRSQSLEDFDDASDMSWLQCRTAAMGFPVAYGSVI